MKCSSCGYENQGDASFCQFCGAGLAAQNPLEQAVSQQSMRPLPADETWDENFSAASGTRPLPTLGVPFSLLPEGALLKDGRYVILKARSSEEQPHVYLVKDSTPVMVCPACESEVTNTAEPFCPSCGADMSGVEPVHLRYLVQESRDEKSFAVESRLLEMGFEHPGLILPLDTFSEAPYGPTRYYLVRPEFSPPLASSLAVPQKLVQVLAWGVSLANALGHLHQRYLTLQGAGLEHIAVEGNVAYWTHLGVIRLIPPDARAQATSYFVQDVRGLAAALFYLATGREQYEPQAGMPKHVTDVFARALASSHGFADAVAPALAFGKALETAVRELRRPGTVTLVVGYATDVGQERSLNEDSLLVLNLSPVYRSVSAPVGIFAVADGMGGHEAGDVASQTAIRTFAREAVAEVLRPATVGEQLPAAGDWLTAATQAASQAVYKRREEAGSNMGTTLVAALFIGDMATLSCVGDSRIYLLSPDGIEQLTTDHSLVERLVASGQIASEEAADHPQRNIIYRVVGDKPGVENDIYEQSVAPGEALLLCSDGLNGMVPDQQIWHIWRTSTSPQEACDRLVEAANQAGGEDNISVVIVQVGL